jgi:hypothetical protein
MTDPMAHLRELLAPLRWSRRLGPISIWHFDAPTRGPVSVWKWGVRVRRHGITLA